MNADSIVKAATTAIETINRVEGFDPAPLAVDYTDLNTGETRKRLPVMAQIAWFRLKYPEGRIAISVAPAQGFFVAIAKVYRNYMDPADCFLAEATASRGPIADKPTVSPREWAQTAAVGIALRNAGFGLQFHTAGEGYDEIAVSELGAVIPQPENPIVTPLKPTTETLATETKPTAEVSESVSLEPQAEEISEEMQLENAYKLPCPLGKFPNKTLGEMVTLDPKALKWIAEKYTNDPVIAEGARLICECALKLV